MNLDPWSYQTGYERARSISVLKQTPEHRAYVWPHEVKTVKEACAIMARVIAKSEERRGGDLTMFTESDIVHEIGQCFVLRIGPAHYEVCENGITHATVRACFHLDPLDDDEARELAVERCNYLSVEASANAV